MTHKFPKILFTLILGLNLALCLIGCQNASTYSSDSHASSLPIANASETKLVTAYLKAIDLVFNTSPELNDGLQYLAIDTSVLVNLDTSSRQQLLNDLQAYNLEILDCSFEALGEQGYLKDGLFEYGLFLKIEDTPVNNNQIQITPSKWRSTTYAVGLSKVVLTLQNNIWEITEEGIAWRQ